MCTILPNPSDIWGCGVHVMPHAGPTFTPHLEVEGDRCGDLHCTARQLTDHCALLKMLRLVQSTKK